MIRRIHFFVAIVCFAILITGCAVPVKEVPLDRVTDLSQGYLQAGMHHEAAGDLVAALRSFKLALTVDPNNQEAIRGCNRLATEIRSSAKRHYDTGLTLQRKGQYSLAKKEFLTALRLYPDYQEARELLTSKKRIEIKGYVVHKVKPDESLSKLAASYYGDYRKFPIIAEYNNLSDAAALSVGQELKIPEISGMELVDSKEDTRNKPVTIDSDSWNWEKDLAEAEGKGPSEGNEVALEKDEEEQITIYRDLGVEFFNDKKYREASIEFNKVLSSNPDDSVVLDYLYRCYFLQAVALYEKKAYLAARDQFKVSLKYKNNCQQCHKYINKCEDSYKKLHYKQGMQFYSNESLNEAIGEWELVKKEDPNYKRVNYLINKAQTILNKLNELKNKE
ncbi:MAG: tetratricopeptide repeat protein [Desulfobacteraceae bacterium]|nr:tetratricopeptide repeat protein [Desulfobacteraceae bacterium]